MPSAAKQQVLESIKSELTGLNGMVLANFKGLTVHQLETLRRKVEAEGGSARIIKNTMLEKAFESNQIAGMEPYLKENTVVFYSKDDMLKILKPIADYTKENDKFSIKGGYFEGKAIGKEGVVAMSKLPGKKEILSMVAGSLSGIISSFVGTINSVMTTFLGTIEAMEKKEQK